MKLSSVAHQSEVLTNYLRIRGNLSDAHQVIKTVKAGEGNMNFTLRIIHTGGTLILKQAGPYVEKYPQISAPIERARVESMILNQASQHEEIRAYFPKVLDFDAENHIQCMEDLGEGSDYLSWYKRRELPDAATVTELVQFLVFLHRTSGPIEPIENLQMRELNASHIFRLPFEQNNGFDLDGFYPGLRQVANETIFADQQIAAKAKILEGIYLNARGPSLLHGDFYPGSWLKTATGLKIIDPEFGFHGPAEFDLGVLMAHLRLCGWDFVRIIEAIEPYGHCDHKLAREFMAIEILRRIFGIAQLPLESRLEERKSLALESIQNLLK